MDGEMTEPKPAGWLVDDSERFTPFWLPYSAVNQAHVDTYRSRGKRVLTMWRGPDELAQAYEALRIKVADLEKTNALK